MSEWQSIIGSNRGSSYGTCVRSTNKSTAQYTKHFLTKDDTLQGLALKYDCSTDEIRRINKLYSTDSIFLREYLLIPRPKKTLVSDPVKSDLPQSSNNSSSSPEKEMDAISFLKQLDSKIMAGKNAVKDYKLSTELYDNNDLSEASAQYLKTSDLTNSNKKSFFSHSQKDDRRQHFKL